MTDFLVLFLGIVVLTSFCESQPIEGPMFIVEPPSTYSFLYIRGGELPCSAYGSPSPSVTWRFQDGTLVTEVEGLRKVNALGTLEFPAIVDSQYDQSIHSTVYVCYAENEAGIIRSRDVTVNGVPSQSYTISLHDEVAMRGNTVVFKCGIPSFVKDYVEVTLWTRNNHPIVSGGRFSILPTGELHIRDLTAEDEQFTYRCNVRNTLNGQTDQAQATLTVVDPVNHSPHIMSSQASLTKLVGDTIEIPCVASGHPLPTYSWKKDGRDIILETRMEMRGGNLVINYLRLSDDGDYTCEISNNKQVLETANVHLGVREPISVYFYPHHRTVDIGDFAYFNCSVTGHPIDTVIWYKDATLLEGLPGVIIFDNGTMMVDEMRRGDQGMYQCVAGNKWEFQEATMQLSLGASAPSVVTAFEEETLHPGPDLHLVCVIAGNPSPTVTWYRDDLQILKNKRIAINQVINADRDVVSYLNITRSKVQDGGTYRCQASNVNGIINHQDRINIYGAPIIRQFRNKTAIAGEIMEVRCIAAGYPIAFIKWYKDSSLLPSNGRQHVEIDGTLRIDDFKKGSDEGKYSCEVGNGLGQSDFQSIYIDVIVPPKIEPMRNILLRAGDRMQMSCFVTSGDPPILVSWLKDGSPLPENVDVTVLPGPSSILYADAAITDLAGNYTCVANNSAATVTYTNEVFVFVPPSFIVYPVDTHVILNHTATLHCNASGYPAPDIQWKRKLDIGGYNFVEVEEDDRISVKENGDLVIVEAVEEDDGLYLCSISNTIGEDSQTALLVIYIPARFEVSEVNITAKVNEEVILECKPDGHSELRIDWFKNDLIYTSLMGKDYQITTEQGDNFNSKLRILKAAREDTAVYTCQASNIYGSDRHTIHLTILEPPESPINVQQISVTSRSFTISWQPGFDGNSMITGYTIEYKNDSDVWQGGVPRVHVLANLTQLRYTVTDLHPAYVYVVRIKSFNSIGVSPLSDEILIKTLEEVPWGQPLNIELSALSSTAIRLVWRQPRADLQNGVIKGYFIRYKETKSSTPSQSVMTSSITNFIESYTLNRLRKFTEYAVEIRAYNEVGAGPWSQQKKILTLEDVPSQPPPSVQATPLGSTVIRVFWSTLPLDSIFGILQGYKIFYKPVRADEDEADLMIKVTTALTSDLIGLEKFTNYSIQVLAFTRIGENVLNCFVYYHKDPSMPARIKAHAQTSTSVMVSWLPPLQINGILQKYILTMTANVEGEIIKSNFTVDSNVTNYLIENLLTDVEYDFYVRAATIVGPGEASNIATEIPPTRVPARIMSFSRNLTVTWKQDVTLACIPVGDPRPMVHWRKAGVQSSLKTGNDYEILSNGALTIYHAMPEDQGKYICQASNSWGSSEEIFVNLDVLVSHPTGTPPAAPALEIVSSTTTTIQVSWISKSNGGSALLGFTLFYKEQHDYVWERIKVNSTLRTFNFKDMKCGTPYQFYITAYNKLGTSVDSNKIRAETDGSTPIAPSTDMILLEKNATLLRLNLESFASGGCPVESFTVQHKLFGHDKWRIAASNIPTPSSTFILDELHPSTWYVIKVTAVNSAGPSDYEFRVATNSYTGGTVPPLVLESKPEEQGLPYYGDPKIFVPVLGGLILFILLCIIAIVLYRHTNHWKTKQATTISAEGCMMTIDMESHIRRDDIGSPNEHEPFLGEGGTPLNNLNNSTKNWIFSPNDDIDACHSVNLPVNDPNINSISPVSFTTFQYPSSQESTQGAVGGVFSRPTANDSPYHNIATRGLAGNENVMTYDSIVTFQQLRPPPLPERPPDLYSYYRSTPNHLNIATQNLSISRNSMDTSYSSAQEELTSHSAKRRTLSSNRTHTIYRSIDAQHSSSNSDLDTGIRNSFVSLADPPVDTDSSSPEQLKKQGARPRERMFRSQTIHSSDACESDDQLDDRYSKCYRPSRAKSGNRGSRKSNTSTKPNSRSKRNSGKSRRHGKRPSNQTNITSESTAEQSRASDGSQKYEAGECMHRHSGDFMQGGMRYYATRINGFMSEPEQSRSARKHRPRRQASTPAPQSNPALSRPNACIPDGTIVGQRKRLSRSPHKGLSTEDSTDHNEIEIEMLSQDQLTDTSGNGYVEEFTIV
ncbi:Down syndrome cell adhesion molecule homolog [Anneissia japonica]|uniref:Down syndrome cell adhesion molecule homolog n=1 Tax=Anneissia japonica TaxID=1529436 RepID=UPI001425509D|nr:Down syndrome cell adhesion molecule homolog [Anneissia japonica]